MLHRHYGWVIACVAFYADGDQIWFLIQDGASYRDPPRGQDHPFPFLLAGARIDDPAE